MHVANCGGVGVASPDALPLMRTRVRSRDLNFFLACVILKIDKKCNVNAVVADGSLFLCAGEVVRCGSE